MNESRFLFVLGMIVLNLLVEGRRTYSLCRICVLSLLFLFVIYAVPDFHNDERTAAGRHKVTPSSFVIDMWYLNDVIYICFY